MPTVMATFRNHDHAKRALDSLRSIFADSALSMTPYPTNRRIDDDEDAPVDPSASSNLVGGTPVATMPAAGYNLVGNSATVDVRLGDLPSLLEAVAETEHDLHQTDVRRGSRRISIGVDCSNSGEVQCAKAILERHGGERLRVTD